MSIKTTEEEFRQYVAHCKWWMVRLSLGQYTYMFTVEASSYDASVVTTDELLASVYLAQEREGEMTIPFLARHEMLEVLVDDSFKELYKTHNDEYIQAKRHNLIHRLEKILSLPTDKEVGFVGKKKSKKAKPIEVVKKKKEKLCQSEK